MLRFALVLAALLVSPPAISARTWHITPDGTGDAPTIQAGIDSSSVGDTVLLAPGVFREHDIVLVAGVSLKSASGDPATTVIDAERKGRVLLGIGLDATTVIEGLTITQGLARWGAGLDCEEGSPVIRRCVFSHNTAETLALDAPGGALLCYEASPLVEDCTFRENVADQGGAVSCNIDSSPSFTRCVFVRNSAWDGGGIYCTEDSAPTLSNCTLVENEIRGVAYPPLDGAGISCAYTAAPVLNNTIIAFSRNGRAIGTQCPWNPSNPVLHCSNLYGNEGGDWFGCFVAEQAGASGNFSADPLFCDLDGGGYMIQSNSPCAPPGATACGLVGALPVGCGPVTVDAMSWGQIKAAYR